MNDVVQSPKDLIKQIRLEYGVDSEDTRPNRYKDIASGTLQLVTEELYESATHFFSELLQNADDNEYTDGVIPSLTLRSLPDRLEFYNNEIGFTSRQVDAICSAAKSTKRDRKQTTDTDKGATGEKGIGFKAVFQVSDRPEIHSNGFHFRFDKTKHGPFGVVIPEWIENETSVFDGTKIVLPLRNDYKLPFEFIKSVQPELLLFLRRIRRLEFNNADLEKSVVLERKDNGNVVTVTRSFTDEIEQKKSTSQTHSYFVQRHTVDMSEIDERARRKIAATEVAVALPLNDKGDFDFDQRTQRQLFAFLPVKNTSLPFLAHADFVVVTSREGVRENLEWNKRLRDALGKCLAKAIMASRNLKHPGSTALRSLIDPKEIPDVFLRPVIEIAMDFLKEKECIPLLGSGWAKPGDAILPDKDGLWKLIETTEICKLLQRSYVDPAVTGITEPIVRLGVKRFNLDSLLQCLSIEEWRSQRPLPWYPRLFAALGKLNVTDKQRDQIRQTPMLPLSQGDVVPATSKNIFRSLGKSEIYSFEKELRLLAPDVLEHESEKDASDADEFLQSVGVTDATSIAVIDKYIVPIYERDDWQKCDEAVLIGHVRYVKDHLDMYTKVKQANQPLNAASRLGGILRVRTTRDDGATQDYQYANRLYIGKAYDDPNDLQSLLGDAIKDRCVSPVYLDSQQHQSSNDGRREWRLFFEKLGAWILPPIYHKGEDIDYIWPDEVTTCLNCGEASQKERFIRLVAENWRGNYSLGASRPPITGSSRPSGMLEALRQTAVSVPDGSTSLLSDCYVASEENVSVFGASVPFLTFAVKQDFAEAVGIVTTPTVTHALKRLEYLQRQSAVDPLQIQAIYKFLDMRFDQHSGEIRNAFRHAPLVLANSQDGLKWMTASDVCWTIPQQLRQFLSIGSLSQTWRDLQGFFCGHIGVSETLDADAYVEALAKVSDSELDVERARSIARAIYGRLRSMISETNGDNFSWLQRLRNETLLFTTKGEWWRNDDNVFAADDNQLSELFADSNTIAFIDLDAKSLTTHERFLHELRVPRLSSAIETTLPNSLKALQWPEGIERIRKRVRFIARFFHHKHCMLFDDAVNDGVIALLQSLDVQSCDPLELDVRLKEETVRHQFAARLVREDGRATLFVNEESKWNWVAVGIELVGLLELPDTEAVAIGNLQSNLPADAEILLQTLNIPELPEDVAYHLFGDDRPEDILKRDGETEINNQDKDTSPDHEYDAPSTHTPSNESSETMTQEVDDIRPSQSITQNDTAGAANQDVANDSQDGQLRQIESAGASKSRQDVGDEMTGNSPNMSSSVAPTEAIGTSSVTQLTDGYSHDSDEFVSSSESQEECDEDNEDTNVSSGAGIGSGGVPRHGEHRASPHHLSGPPTTPKKSGERNRSSKLRSNSQRERLRSYVVPDKPDSSDADIERKLDSEHSERKKKIEAAAIAAVLADENKQKRDAVDVNVTDKNNKGYDILSHDPKTNQERYIEVKGISDLWDVAGVMMTPAQFDFSMRHGDKSWLYVVEDVFSDSPAIYRIQNFAQRVWRYGFDDGWKNVAEIVDQKVDQFPTPTRGLVVRLCDGREGRVISVQGAGKVMGVHIELNDGSIERFRWESSLLSVIDLEGG